MSVRQSTVAKKPSGMSDFDWDTHNFGKPVSRPVVNGITMAYFPGKIAPYFYGGDADRSRGLYGNRLGSSDPRVQAILNSGDVYRPSASTVGRQGSPVATAPSTRPPGPSRRASIWREMADNTFGTGNHHGDIYNMAKGLVDAPQAIVDLGGNILNGGYHAAAGTYDELTGNYAGSAAHARAAQASTDKTFNAVGAAFGANKGGALYNLVDAGGRYAGGDSAGAGREVGGVIHDAVAHPVNTLATILPMTKAALLSRASRLEEVAVAAQGAEKSQLLTQASKLRYAANGGAVGEKLENLMDDAGTMLDRHPQARRVMSTVNQAVKSTRHAVDDVNNFRKPSIGQGRAAPSGYDAGAPPGYSDAAKAASANAGLLPFLVSPPRSSTTIRQSNRLT